VAELADALGSGPSSRQGSAGSSPVFGTLIRKDLRQIAASPFAFLAPESVANRWQQRGCVGLAWQPNSCLTLQRWTLPSEVPLPGTLSGSGTVNSYTVERLSTA
jgi:hypothetical protein